MRKIILFIEAVYELSIIFFEELIQWLARKIFPPVLPKKPQGYQADFDDPKILLSRKYKGFCLTGTHSISKPTSFKNALVIGGTGVGKSSTVLLPSLYKIEGSLVVHDPSGELYQKSAGYLKKKGYSIKILDFSDPQKSDRFNPLSRIKTTSEINKVANLVIRTALGNPKGDPFWNLQAVSLLSLLITLVKSEDYTRQNFRHVRILLNQLSNDPEAFKQKVENQNNLFLISEFKTFQNYDEKVKAGVIATVSSALQIFTDDAVAKITSRDTLALDVFRVQKTALFIQNPIADQHYYAVLSSLFFEQLFGTLLRRIPKKWDHDVFCLIDEAGVLYLPSLGNTIANIRKYRAGIMLAIQDMNQLIHHYGHYEANTIKANCFAKLYFTGQSSETARDLENSLGRFQYKDENEKIQSRPLLTIDEIRTMPAKEALLVAGNHKPMMVKLKPYYQSISLKKIALIPPPLSTDSPIHYHV